MNTAIAAWRARVPRLAADCAERWELDVGPPFAAAAVLRRLWRSPPERHGFRSLAGEARRWAAELPGRFERHGRPFERALLDRAVAWIGELIAAAPGDVAVLHQTSTAATSCAPTASPGWRSTPSRSEALGLDRERMRRWAVVHAVAWGMADEEWFPDIVACAVWLDAV